MNIVVPDDYQHKVRRLPCFELLSAHRVPVYTKRARSLNSSSRACAMPIAVITLTDRLEFYSV